MPTERTWAVKPIVPEPVYTDRQEFLDYFYHAALEAAPRRTMSTVLLGQRRMGKTEIFKRVVNRLFFEQDHRDPQAVVPVFFSFPDPADSRQDFALNYVENFVRWYTAFRLRNPDLLRDPEERNDLIAYVQEHLPISEGFRHALGLLRAIERGGVTLPEQKAVELPRRVSDWDDSTIVMFLDEFQNTKLPECNFNILGFMQEAVESPTCPHFVTGSAMTMLVEILGKGSLYGRFTSEPIERLTDFWGSELALRVARHYGADLPDVMAPVVSERCGGNPYYITAVVRQSIRQRRVLQDEETLNEMLAVDISSGFIWAELHDQVTRWIVKVNALNITKWILYLAALETEREISLERIQKELWAQERADVPVERIKEVLIKLARGDLLEYKGFGDWFGHVNDPILLEFLKVWGRIEVAHEDRGRVSDDLRRKYLALHRKFAEYTGYLAEVYMIQVLWNGQRRTLPGHSFHSPEDVSIPRFTYIDHRRRLNSGVGQEIDIYAAAGPDLWIAESKWWDGRKVGRDVVERLLAQADEIRRREGADLRIRIWLFAHDGVTAEAETLVRAHQILWSARADLDALLETVHLRKLPVIAEKPAHANLIQEERAPLTPLPVRPAQAEG